MTFNLPAGLQIVGIDLQGNQSIYEIMKSRNDYDSDILVDNVVSTIVTAYQGQTTEDIVTVDKT